MSARRSPLAWRLAALTLGQLVALIATVIAVGWILPPPRHPPPPPQGVHGPHHLPPPPPLPWLLTLAGAAVVLAGSAALTWRWVVAPIDKLSRAARSAREGDLDARAALRPGDELGDVATSLDEMTGRVKKLVFAERELLANVSHELRTPLARIRVAMDLAAEGDAASARTALAEIATDLAELESIVDDVLTATRLATDDDGPTALALHREELAPRTICERAAERFRARHPRRVLDVEIAEDLPPIVVDPVLFRRVVDNLLENADKYSPDADAHVVLGASSRGGDVELAVSDRGIGIAPADLPRVFEPFFRGERSRTRGAGGVGLGLTLAKRIVDAHGGTITARSRTGGGTVLTIRISRA